MKYILSIIIVAFDRYKKSSSSIGVFPTIVRYAVVIIIHHIIKQQRLGSIEISRLSDKTEYCLSLIATLQQVNIVQYRKMKQH